VTGVRSVSPVVAIELDDISVRFDIPTERILSFKEYVLRRLTAGIERRVLWALKDVSLKIQAGEVLGVVGRNGAGKSTLLKVVSRVLQPTSGRVVIRGKLAPLLELGAGFHFDLTGRENVYLNAALLGHARKRVEEHITEVVEFSELHEFFDVPIRNYSSGMLARLGFSVATLFRPDVLLIDEVLAVGDAAFQKKCLARIREFRSHGTTIMLVSHQTTEISGQCDRVLWLEAGRLAALGEPGEVLSKYDAALADRAT
jgi:ABC-type polysaccharide/polyol phosphate transport system ATPase subunit